MAYNKMSSCISIAKNSDFLCLPFRIMEEQMSTLSLEFCVVYPELSSVS